MTGAEEGTFQSLPLLPGPLVLLPALGHPQSDNAPSSFLLLTPLCAQPPPIVPWEEQWGVCGSDFTHSLIFPTPFSFVALPLPLRGFTMKKAVQCRRKKLSS